MKKSGVLVLLIVIVGIGAVFLLTKKSNLPSNNAVVTPTEKMTEVVPSVDTRELKAGGSSYREASGAYTFLYPADFILDTKDPKHIRIYKIGATQRGQTEMYDGVLVVFEVVPLARKNLSDWVDTHITESTADGTSEITIPKKEVKLNNYTGYTYTIRGLGESKNYVFQKDSSSDTAVLISTSVNDPASVGFQSEVDKILSTLEIFK